jgi:hypothetical protein
VKFKKILIAAAILFALPLFVWAQTAQTQGNRFRRTTTKTERIDLKQGGSVTVLGAPVGSITIESWQQPLVEITAEIEIEADSQDNLNLLSQVNSFVADAEMNHIRVLTTGTHDKQFLKKNFKKLPKQLLNLPFRVDYRIKVPSFTDLEINSGRGDLNLNGVEGVIVIKAGATENANLTMSGGALVATFGSGKINFNATARSWRGNGADIQLASGELNVSMPPDMNAEINAEILRTGQIENSLLALKPRDRSKFTEKAMQARAGAGGAKFLFTVGDGALRLKSENGNGK